MALPKILKNAGMASIQVLVSGGILFVLYFFLLRTLGAAELGIWSIILAVSSAARLSELGLAGGVVRFVARYLARQDDVSASAVIQTAALSIAGLMAIVVFPLYPLISYVIEYFLLPAEYLAALSLLPYALLGLWFGSIGSVFTSGLDGVLRTDIRSWIMMCSAAVHLLLVVMFVPSYGLIGLGYAQVLQAVFIMVLSWWMLRRSLRSLPFLPRRWNLAVFKEMLGYGLNIQAASIAQLLVEPTTKMLLSKFAGLESVAYFEMSNRMVMQFRALVVSANQAMVPIFSQISEASPGRLLAAYRESYGVFLFVALPLFSGLLAMSPIISELWIGSYETSFVSFSVILTAGWFLNTLNAPSYFSNMGTGHVGWNTLAQGAIGILNICLGLILGLRFGGIGVVVGLAVALAVGSAVIVVNYHFRNNIPFSVLVPREQRWLILASLIVPVITWCLYLQTPDDISLIVVGFLCTALTTSVFGLVTWFHPVRHQLLRLARSGTRV